MNTPSGRELALKAILAAAAPGPIHPSVHAFDAQR